MAAVVDLRGFRFSGALAWLSAHVFFLIGLRNRRSVMSECIWSYVTYQRHARITIGRGRVIPS